jgi:hypothetical protein
MKHEIDALTIITREFKNLTAEKPSLDAREAVARQELEAAASAGPLDDPKISRKISEATASLDAIHARRAFIDRELRPLLGRLRDALRAADAQWTRIVRAEGDRIAANFYKVNTPFYLGSEREAKRQLNHETLPAWNKNNRALWHGSALELNADNALATVSSFNGQVSAHFKNFNLAVQPSETSKTKNIL